MQLATLAHNLPGTEGDQNTSYSYNPAGQIATMARTKDIYAWTGLFNIDRPYASNGRNQLTSAGATALGYDARGNLTTSGPDSYGYSSENFLTAAPGAMTLGYDPVGRLYQTATPAVTTRFAWDGDRMVAEYNAANVLQRRYVHGPGVDAQGPGFGDKASGRQKPTDTVEIRVYAAFLRPAFLRSFGSSNALRSRIFFGVTSTISSSSI